MTFLWRASIFLSRKLFRTLCSLATCDAVEMASDRALAMSVSSCWMKVDLGVVYANSSSLAKSFSWSSPGESTRRDYCPSD